MPVVISGSISGQVLPVETDPTIWTVSGTDTISTFTDLNGFFKLMALPEGNYDVNITHIVEPYPLGTAGSVKLSVARSLKR